MADIAAVLAIAAMPIFCVQTKKMEKSVTVSALLCFVVTECVIKSLLL